jgi:putative endonuclease
MLFGHITQAAIRSLDWIAGKILTPEQVPQHQRTGRRGEEDAYFYLRKKGYVIVARNFRSPHHRGEIDLIGWDKDVLCFIEVKTRTTRDVKPAEAAVDWEKTGQIILVSRDYLRHLPLACQWRLDVLSVYYSDATTQPQFELFQNTQAVS